MALTNGSLDSALLDGFQNQKRVLNKAEYPAPSPPKESKLKKPADSSPDSPTHPHTQTPKLLFTESAIKQLTRLRDKKGGQNLGVRVGVKGGGCSGLSYFLIFESERKAIDMVVDFESPTLSLTQLRAWVDPNSGRFMV